MMQFIVEEWCHITPIEFQKLENSWQGALKLFWLVVAHCPIKTLYVGVSFIFSGTRIL
jgi:hypothetical protein